MKIILIFIDQLGFITIKLHDDSNYHTLAYRQAKFYKHLTTRWRYKTNKLSIHIFNFGDEE